MNSQLLTFHEYNFDRFVSSQLLTSHKIAVFSLQEQGKLCMIQNTAAACLMKSYNELLTDVGAKNGIVTLIRNACLKAHIEDVTVPPSSGFRWNAVMRSWSTKITKDFETSNSHRPNQEAPIVTVLHSLGD